MLFFFFLPILNFVLLFFLLLLPLSSFTQQNTGDGSIEEDEFVGFLEGQLDPESQNMLVDSALSLSSKKRHNKSTLVVDQILCTHHFGTDVEFSTSPTIISFITILQELERLYIYRSAYQQKVWCECEGKKKFYILYGEKP